MTAAMSDYMLHRHCVCIPLINSCVLPLADERFMMFIHVMGRYMGGGGGGESRLSHEKGQVDG